MKCPNPWYPLNFRHDASQVLDNRNDFVVR